MTRLIAFIAVVAVADLGGCSKEPTATGPRQTPPAPTATPIKTPFVPKNGDYPGRGKVKRIEIKGGSVELDHEAIPDVAPAMKNEFFVSDKTMLNGLKLGDDVNFTLRYNNGQETIVAISKIK
jgi:Cu(I)/Ag(I) efflux system protein CusF